MALFVVSYDLHKIRNYEPLHAGLQRGGAVRILESLWLWQVNDTAQGVRDALMNLVDQDDALAVIEIKPKSDWASRNALQPGVQWLKTNVHA